VSNALKSLPKLITTSVVRGSQQGESHGGVYTIDFRNQEVVQHVDWNTSEIDFSGRGWDRGLRGIEFFQDRIYIAASDELFWYNAQFEIQDSYRNPYLKHCHEICRRDHLLFLTSTGYDSLLAFHVEKQRFIWGLHIARGAEGWQAQSFNPNSESGPPFGNNLHLNNVYVDSTGVYLSGLRTHALLRLNSALELSEACTLPAGAHNARPFRGGILFNDTHADHVRYVGRDQSEQAFPIMTYQTEEITFAGVDDSKIARQGFGRGLCTINTGIIAGGSSPSTISVYDLDSGGRVAAVNLSMDIRNAIHGLEVWPFE